MNIIQYLFDNNAFIALRYLFVRMSSILFLFYSYDIGLSLKDCLTDMAERLNVRERDLTTLNQWLYIFKKGYVNILRSRRALPNDYWTAETVEDYMRCKVINFPIGVHNEEMRSSTRAPCWR